MSRVTLAVLFALFLVALVNAGVPRVGRFQGALNRGRECLVAPDRDECRTVLHKREVEADEAPELWFHEQRLDHFDPSEQRTWSQRFFMNQTFHVAGGPVFLLLGGEGPIHATDVSTHFAVSEQAQQFNALTISLEHRFYGDSMPLKDTSTESLRYLTSQQALADFAYFLQWLPSEYPSVNGSKVIVFGGSYSGNLAAWFREKYPHLASGAIASSGPVHAQLDFPEYLETVSASLGSSCSAIFAAATASIEQMLSDPSGQGRASLQKTFNTCDPIVTEEDAATFVSFLADEVAGIVQYNNDNNNYEPMNIDGLCAGMASISDPVSAWASFINTSLSGACTPVSYAKQVKEMSIVRPNTAGRSWYWQTCTEFGYYQTGSSPNQPFSPRITLEYFVNLCQDVFGVPLKPDTDWINSYYGSTNLQATRVYLPNGSIDPWHTLGVLERPNLQDQVTLMQGTAHVADLYPPSPNDLPALTATREAEMAAVARWLQLPVSSSS